MFGYIKPYIPELKVKQHILYKAYYCGLCKRQKKLTGFLSPFTLSYDFVMLALVRSALLGEIPEIKTGVCSYNPLRKKQYVAKSPALDYTARVAAVLNYYKVKDDIADSKGLKKLKYICLLPFVSHSRKKAMKADLPESEIIQSLKRLSEIEKSGLLSPDVPSEEFGNLLSSIASHGIGDPLAEFACRKIFFSLGKWIYLVDSLDDLPKDIKSNSYNPFASSELDSKELEDLLQLTLRDGDKYIQKLADYDRDIIDIIKNIYLLGTEKIGSTIIDKLNSKEERKSTK